VDRQNGRSRDAANLSRRGFPKRDHGTGQHQAASHSCPTDVKEIGGLNSEARKTPEPGRNQRSSPNPQEIKVFRTQNDGVC
jgi:hypothetical protein